MLGWKDLPIHPQTLFYMENYAMSIVNVQRAAIDAILLALGIQPKPHPAALPRPFQKVRVRLNPELGPLFRMGMQHLIPAGISHSYMPGSQYTEVDVLILTDIDQGRPFTDVEAIRNCHFAVLLREAAPEEVLRDLGTDLADAKCVQALAVVVGPNGAIVDCMSTEHSRAYPAM